jgi:hypothetical protein
MPCCLNATANPTLRRIFDMRALAVIRVVYMKTTLLMLCCFAPLLVCGCAASHCDTAREPVRPTKASYDPASDITTLEGGGFTWYMKGNVTNLVVTPK